MNNLTYQAISATTGILAPKYQTPPDYDFWRTKEHVTAKEAMLLVAGINPELGHDVREYWSYFSSRQQASFAKAETVFKEFDEAVKHGAEWLALAQGRGLLPNDLQTDQQTFAEYQAAKLVREIIGRKTSQPWTEKLLARIERIAEKEGHAAAVQDLWRELSNYEEKDGEPEQKCFRWLQGELDKRPATETAESEQAKTLGQWLGDKQASVSSQSNKSADWTALARTIADELFDHDTNMKCRDSLIGYSRRVMCEMQKRGIHGPRGRIDNSNTIQRDALQSDLWWKKKRK